MSIHIDTQAQTCAQTNIDVLQSSMYFHVFLGGLIFHARPLLIFPRRLFKYCVGGMLVPWHLAFHTLTMLLLFFNGSLFEASKEPGGRCPY